MIIPRTLTQTLVSWEQTSTDNFLEILNRDKNRPKRQKKVWGHNSGSSCFLGSQEMLSRLETWLMVRPWYKTTPGEKLATHDFFNNSLSVLIFAQYQAFAIEHFWFDWTNEIIDKVCNHYKSERNDWPRIPDLGVWWLTLIKQIKTGGRKTLFSYCRSSMNADVCLSICQFAQFKFV